MFTGKDMWSFEDSDIHGRRSPDLDPASSIIKDTLHKYTTPFYNECRAYGRLREMKMEHVSVRAHGYVKLQITDALWPMVQPIIPKYATGFMRNVYDVFGSSEFYPDVPLWGIVKDWVESRHTQGSPNLQMPSEEITTVYWQQFRREPTYWAKWLRDLHQLHKCGIVMRDVKCDQWIESTLVDLSCAFTIPHFFGPEAGLKPRWTFQSLAAHDLVAMQRCIVDPWNADRRKAWGGGKRALKYRFFRAYPDPDVCQRLRSRNPYTQRPYLPLRSFGTTNLDSHDMDWLPPYDPGEFDWRSAARKAKALKDKRDAAASAQPKRVVKRRGGRRSRPRPKTGSGSETGSSSK